MKTVCYIIPYSAKALYLLHTIERKYKAKWSVGPNEEITIIAKEKYIPAIEKTLAPIV